jgi:CTP:molybdopterin cytidylyltransferase MocA
MNQSMQIGAIILAAGKSKRFGAPKVLQTFLGKPFTRCIIDNLIASGLSDEIVLVLGHNATEFSEKLPDLKPARVITNKNYEKGQFSSIQCGLRSLAETVDGVLMSLIDQPHIQRKTYQQVIQQAHLRQNHIIIPTYSLHGGHPIYLPKQLFKPILTEKVSSNLRNVLREHTKQIFRIEVEDSGVLRDTDYPEDLKRNESLYRIKLPADR